MGRVYKAVNQNGDTISHWRTKGSKNGVRLWQHEDGSYTTAGRNSKPGGRYNQAENHEDGSSVSKTESASSKKAGSSATSKTNASGSSKSSSSRKKSSVTTINDVIFSETTKNVLCAAGMLTLFAGSVYLTYALEAYGGDPAKVFSSIMDSTPLDWFTTWAAGVEKDFNDVKATADLFKNVVDGAKYAVNQSTDMYSEVIDSTLKSSEDYVKTYKDYLKNAATTVDDNVTKFGERAANAEATAKATGEYANRFYDKRAKEWSTYSSLKYAKNEGSSMAPSPGDIIEPDWYTKSDPKLLRGR